VKIHVCCTYINVKYLRTWFFKQNSIIIKYSCTFINGVVIIMTWVVSICVEGVIMYCFRLFLIAAFMTCRMSDIYNYGKYIMPRLHIHMLILFFNKLVPIVVQHSCPHLSNILTLNIYNIFIIY